MKLYVTDNGSVILPNGTLAKPGDVIDDAVFARMPANLQNLLNAGALAREKPQVTGLDVKRDSSLPALPHEIEDKKGEPSLKSVQGKDEKAIQAKLSQIKAEQAEKADELPEMEPPLTREQVLAELADSEEELTPDQARQLGLIR